VISINGLGALKNKISSAAAVNPTLSRLASETAFEITNSAKSIDGKTGLTVINSKHLYYQKLGSGDGNMIFIHGLGGTHEFWRPLISTARLAEKATLHLFDFEGHGLSPTHPLSKVSIESLADDVAGLASLAQVSQNNPAIVVAHSMGCIIASRFALNHPTLVKKLILLGPPPSPLPEFVTSAIHARAQVVRASGMSAILDDVVEGDLSAETKKTNPMGVAALRLSHSSQDPESYAKACSAIADAAPITLEDIAAETLMVTGDEDKISPPALVEAYTKRISKAKYTILPNVGHWHVFENVVGVSDSISGFI
jgi:pimeloyl-ACP methyl ester carboxylesterase